MPHKAAVPIQSNDKQQTETLALPTSRSSTTYDVGAQHVQHLYLPARSLSTCFLSNFEA